MSIQTKLSFVAKHVVDVADEEPCLPNHVLIASDAGDNEEHAQLTDELIADLTDTCINIGNVAKGLQLFCSKNGVHVAISTAHKYVAYFKKNKAYFQKKSCGRPPLLTKQEADDLLAALEYRRKRAKKITCRRCVHMAKGIVKHYRPTVSETLCSALSIEWARLFLKSHGFEKMKRTTTRTVAPHVVKRNGAIFWEALAKIRGELGVVDLHLMYNFDEFFVQLDDDNRNWTWTRRRSDNAVPIAESKLGFTAGICTNGAGEVLLVQLIWKGKTSAVHVALQHNKIVQMHREGTHFQDAGTWRVVASEICDRIAAAREASGCGDKTAVFFYDAAPQHSQVDAFQRANIVQIELPKKLTHIFQPADQYIIASVKQLCEQAEQKWVSEIFAKNDLSEANKLSIVTSHPVLRRLKFEHIADSIDRINPMVIVRSWQITGLTRALGHDLPPDVRVRYDEVSAMADNDELSDDSEVESDVEGTLLNALGMHVQLDRENQRGEPQANSEQAANTQVNDNQQVDEEEPCESKRINLHHQRWYTGGTLRGAHYLLQCKTLADAPVPRIKKPVRGALDRYPRKRGRETCGTCTTCCTCMALADID